MKKYSNNKKTHPTRKRQERLDHVKIKEYNKIVSKRFRVHNMYMCMLKNGNGPFIQILICTQTQTHTHTGRHMHPIHLCSFPFALTKSACILMRKVVRPKICTHRHTYIQHILTLCAAHIFKYFLRFYLPPPSLSHFTLHYPKLFSVFVFYFVVSFRNGNILRQHPCNLISIFFCICVCVCRAASFLLVASLHRSFIPFSLSLPLLLTLTIRCIHTCLFILSFYLCILFCIFFFPFHFVLSVLHYTRLYSISSSRNVLVFLPMLSFFHFVYFSIPNAFFPRIFFKKQFKNWLAYSISNHRKLVHSTHNNHHMAYSTCILTNWKLKVKFVACFVDAAANILYPGLKFRKLIHTRCIRPQRVQHVCVWRNVTFPDILCLLSGPVPLLSTFDWRFFASFLVKKNTSTMDSLGLCAKHFFLYR